MSNVSPPPVIRRTGPFERLVALSGARHSRSPSLGPRSLKTGWWS
jgi:hypothetical protein